MLFGKDERSMIYKDFSMAAHGFVGHMAGPENKTDTAVIVIMGGEKSILPGKNVAERFAQLGFAAMAVSLFGAEDTFFIDWVLFAHLKIFRLPGTEHMDKEYAQKWFHIKGMIFPGSLFLVVISLLTGLLVMIIK